MTSSQTSFSMIGYGPIWSMGPNGSIWSIRGRLMILPCCLCSVWGSLTRVLQTIVCTKWLKRSGTGLPSHFNSYPGYWSLNPRWGEWLKDVWCPSNTLLTGGKGAWKSTKTSWVHCRLWLKVPATYLPITDWVHSKCSCRFQVKHMMWVHLWNILNVILTCAIHLIPHNS